MSITAETRFLVVDDIDAMRRVTVNQLKSLGVEKIMHAANGQEALRMLKHMRFDVVLSDWNMPGMNGLELLKAVRADNRLSQIPFVMITAEADRSGVAEAIACGVSGLLVKPYSASHLKMRVEKAMTRQPRVVSSDVPLFDYGSVAIQAASAARSTILVVDDIPDNLRFLSGLFKDDYRVKVAHSGEKALDICCSDDPPDMVLLDVMMPGMDGFEVARRMRQHPNAEHIPVIFVTAMTDSEARNKGMELGAVDFVNKPVDPEVLIPRVRNFMRYVDMHKELQGKYDAMLENAQLKEDVEHITRHDLKGPLAGVVGMVQLLVEDGGLNRKQLELLQFVEEAALQTLNMVNMSSELYKIETGRYELDAQPVKIGELLRRVVHLTREAFRDKQITISVDTDVNWVGQPVPFVLGDAMLCYSLFHNLIKNACEAAPEQSRVEVTLHNETPLRVTMLNTGAVPSEIREHFFDKHVTSGKAKGSGLGTYSAKLLTEAQNGSISLEVSDMEDKTTINVTLPRYVDKGLLRS